MAYKWIRTTSSSFSCKEWQKAASQNRTLLSSFHHFNRKEHLRNGRKPVPTPNFYFRRLLPPLCTTYIFGQMSDTSNGVVSNSRDYRERLEAVENDPSWRSVSPCSVLSRPGH